MFPEKRTRIGGELLGTDIRQLRSRETAIYRIVTAHTRGLTLRGMAAKLDLSPVYLSNIENDRRPAPTRAYLERLEQELHLSKVETEQMLDLAAKSQNNRVSADLPDYIMDREIVRAALRTAKEADATDQEWQEFIDRITQRAKKSKEGGEIDA